MRQVATGERASPSSRQAKAFVSDKALAKGAAAGFILSSIRASSLSWSRPFDLKPRYMTGSSTSDALGTELVDSAAESACPAWEGRVVWGEEQIALPSKSPNRIPGRARYILKVPVTWLALFVDAQPSRKITAPVCRHSASAPPRDLPLMIVRQEGSINQVLAGRQTFTQAKMHEYSLILPIFGPVKNFPALGRGVSRNAHRPSCPPKTIAVSSARHSHGVFGGSASLAI
jgi:hypothetical protein